MKRPVATTISILYQCPHYIIINKPPFCYSQPPDTSRRRGNHQTEEETVLALLARSHPHLFAETLNAPFCEPKLVHRLDYEVSGAMLLATSSHAARWFSRNLKYGGHRGSPIGKRYVALLDGNWKSVTAKLLNSFSDGIDIISSRENGNVKINFSDSNWLNGTVDMDIQGKPSLTKFWIPKPLQTQHPVLAMFEPVTGRKHQLRLHSASGLAFPIVGDSRYGPGSLQNTNANLALHSAMVNVQFGQAQVTVQAPLMWNRAVWRPFIDDQNLLLDKRLYEPSLE